MASSDPYLEFIKSKITVASREGFDVRDVHPSLMPHQCDAVTWAAGLGRALIAMSFGLGKSRIQIELARQVHQHTGQPFLIVCPLGVKHQFINEDGPEMGTRWQYVRNDAEALAAGTPYLITNYERVRDGNITPAFIDTIGGVSLLDEYGPDLLRPICRDCWFDTSTLLERLRDEREAAGAMDKFEDSYLTDAQIEILDDLIARKLSRAEVRRLIVDLTRRIDWLRRDHLLRFAQWGQVTPKTYPVINNQYSFLEVHNELIYFSAIAA